MHNPLKIAAAAGLTCLMLCSCSNGELKVYETEKEYDTGMGKVKVEIPQFECKANTNFADSINAEYENTVLSLLDEFIEKTQKAQKPSELKIESDVKLNNGRIVSVVSDGEVYTNEAHGEKFRISKTIDFESGRVLNLDDIFTDESWKQAADVKMQKLAQSGEERYRDLWEQPVMKNHNSEDFYLTEDAVVIYFPPYKLSYYRKGFVEFELKYDEFAGYINKEESSADREGAALKLCRERNIDRRREEEGGEDRRGYRNHRQK